jgi:hypothetical protein
VLATRRARSRRTGRGDRASWAGRWARHLGVAPHRRRRSEHDPQAYGLAGSRGGVGRRDTRRSGHTLWRCGLFRKYVVTVRPLQNPSLGRIANDLIPVDVLATPMEDRGSNRAPTSETNTPGITASPNLHSRAEICYRTMPRTSVPADMQLRPDLRLGVNDTAVRRVGAVVSWFERTAGLD